MGRIPGAVLVALGLAVAASCGGSAFTSGGGEDAGGDGPAVPDGAADTRSAADASSGGSDGPSVDAHPDVVDEPPPTCTGGFACVPAVPNGWSGPVELYAGANHPPPCTTDFASSYDGNDQLSAPDATCSCTCNASATQCGAPSLSFFGTSVCVAGTSCDSVNLQPSICTTVNAAAACGGGATSSQYMTASSSPVLGGTCSAQSGRQLPTPTWGAYAQACSSTTAVAPVDCASGSVCAPKPAAPYGPTLCVSQVGDVPCPGSGYTTKHVYFGSVSDVRSCTDCTCGSLTGASCGAKVDAFSSRDGSCSGLPITYVTPFSCDAVSQPADLRLTITPQNGSCSANPVSPTGAATPASPTTFCCLP